MIFMILYQNGKKLGEIVHDMSNKETRDAFRRKERCIVVLYQFLILFVTLINVFQFLAYDISYGTFGALANNNIKKWFDIIEGLALASLGLGLLW